MEERKAIPIVGVTTTQGPQATASQSASSPSHANGPHTLSTAPPPPHPCATVHPYPSHPNHSPGVGGSVPYGGYSGPTDHPPPGPYGHYPSHPHPPTYPSSSTSTYSPATTYGQVHPPHGQSPTTMTVLAAPPNNPQVNGSPYGMPIYVVPKSDGNGPRSIKVGQSATNQQLTLIEPKRVGYQGSGMGGSGRQGSGYTGGHLPGSPSLIGGTHSTTMTTNFSGHSSSPTVVAVGGGDGMMAPNNMSYSSPNETNYPGGGYPGTGQQSSPPKDLDVPTPEENEAQEKANSRCVDGTVCTICLCCCLAVFSCCCSGMAGSEPTSHTK